LVREAFIMKKALIVHGGWEGHDPVGIAKLFGLILEKNGFSVETSDTLDAFKMKKNFSS
jgi:type 1 glutamine amidotransferase